MNIEPKVQAGRALQKRLGLLFAAAALSACTAYGPSAITPGTPRAEVLLKMGPPTAVHEPASPTAARRLEYARGPAGKHTYFLDFGADDRLLRWEQVLSEARFDAIRAGMTAAEVRAQIGTPALVREIRWQSQQVWSYRFVGPFCRWFMVGIGRDDRVVDTSYGPDPECEPLTDD